MKKTTHTEAAQKKIKARAGAGKEKGKARHIELNQGETRTIIETGRKGAPAEAVFNLQKGAKLEYFLSASAANAKRTFVLGENAEAKITVASFGSGSLNIETRLVGKKAKTSQRSAFFGKKGEQFSFTTKVFHEAENTESSILTKGALSGGSAATNESEVWISKNAGGSISALREKDLQLDDGVSSTSTPAMFIQNNTSQATHGATVSRIAEEALFYITTRGVCRKEAERLVLEGFFAEIADPMPEGLRKEFWGKIGGMAGAKNGC